MSLSSKIVDKMFENDFFSQWLGIQRVEESPGKCTLEMTIRKEMLNGFGIAHGAITYAIADSALAFAANGHGRKCVSVETSISHVAPLKEGDKLTAVAEEKNMTNKIAVYYITLYNQEKTQVALFKGTVYRTSKNWEV
jgi:acyl-CoA thioesterase